MRILVTGGCGFVGSALIRYLLDETNADIINVDKLTYASNADALRRFETNTRYFFEKKDICSQRDMDSLFGHYRPNYVFHLAAETHVDRSIDAPRIFLQTNFYGTFVLLEAARTYCDLHKPEGFRFVHVSTDEVYGSLSDRYSMFTEKSQYQPNSPYSATKAASDHLVRAWGHTYGVPVIITHCSNNYGPFQNPEKLIPLTIERGLNSETIPLYGDGQNVRDWLHVDDHVHGLYLAATLGKPGQVYNFGGNEEWTNRQIVNMICVTLDGICPRRGKHQSLIEFVEDRPGHDFRYAVNATKAYNELHWKPKIPFIVGLKTTVQWYVVRKLQAVGIKPAGN